MGDEAGVAVPQRSTDEPSARYPQTEETRPRDGGRFQTLRRKIYIAAREGDWEGAKKIMDDNADLLLKSITLDDLKRTALLLAANVGRTEFVEEMVKIHNDQELKYADLAGRNVLHHVAIASGVSAAKAIVEKLPMLVQEEDSNGLTPLHDAARFRHPSKAKEMVDYLYTKTDIGLIDSDTAQDLVVAVTASGCYNVALEILKKHPILALAISDRGHSILHVLASRPSAFPTEKWKKTSFPWTGFKSKRANDAIQLVHLVCQELQKKDDSSVVKFLMPECDSHIPATLHLATENGVFKLVVLCLKYFPDMIWFESHRLNLIHVAVKHRRVDLFNHVINLIGNNFKEVACSKEVLEESNILHMAALLAPTPQLHSIAGPTFQLQRELQWFKAVESLVYYEQIDEKNLKEQKPIDLFYEEHKDLIKDAKQWITVTSNSCMVVAALVATVAFASMITVPGGNDSGTGMPVLSRNQVFIVFSISNAFSMISSAIALLMFLSLQTSRFTTEDFLATVPKNLLRGLLSLFLAVTTMMIAFGMAIGMALETRLKWAYIPIIVAACIPTIIFTKLQLPLLFQTLGVTSGTTLLPKQRSPRKSSLLEDAI